MSFSAVDILAEFIESASHVVAAQREFDYHSFVANRRRWDTDEERARCRARYAKGQHIYFSRREVLKRAARKSAITRLAPAREVLRALREARQKARSPLLTIGKFCHEN